MDQHLGKIADAAPTATYGGAAASVAFWGLHISEICVILSTLVSVLGFGLQLFLAMHRLKKLEKRQDAQATVVEAVAESHRALDAGKADKNPS